MRGRRNRRKSGRSLLIWLAPLALVAVAVVFSPREGEGADPGGRAAESGALLVEGRHYDWVAVGSLLGLMDRLDPGQALARRVQTEDSLVVYLPGAAENPRAVRIFLNRRDPADYPGRLPEDAPFRVREEGKGKFGFHFPKREMGGRKMAPVPFDMLAGLLAEPGYPGGRQAVEKK
jgi:hypothetical protein